MAIQALPLLLAGAGGVYVYTRAKKKKRARAKDCPPENTITLGSSQSVGIRSREKHGESASPFKQASYYIDEVLPEGCDKASKDSRVKMQLGTKEKPINFDISVPDLYMLILSGAINERFSGGKLNQKQSEKFWADGLDWYKKTTEKNFDVASLGLEKFAEALAVAMQEAMQNAFGEIADGGKGKKKEQLSCPESVQIVVDPQKRNIIRNIYQSEIARGNKNAFGIADEVFALLAPQNCTNRDFETRVEAVFVAPGGDDVMELNMASFYASIVFNVFEELLDARILSEAEANIGMAQLRGNYRKLTGEDLPQNLF